MHMNIPANTKKDAEVTTTQHNTTTNKVIFSLFA